MGILEFIGILALHFELRNVLKKKNKILMVSTYWNHKRLLIDYNQLFSCKTRIININFKLERMKDYAFVEAWKTHCRDRKSVV